MDTTRRHFLAVAAALGVGGPALAGCAGGTLPEPDTAAAGFGERASGTIAFWCRSETLQGTQKVVDAFERSQDRVRVDVTPIPGGQFVTKLATSIRGRAVPDVVDCDDINSTLFAFREAFTDLTDLVEALPYAQQLSPGHLALATRDGRRYAVPFLADNSALWYSVPILEKAGVDPAGLDDAPALLDAAEKISSLGGRTSAWSIALNSPGILGFVVAPMVWADGSRMVKGEIGAQQADVADNTTVRKVLELYRDLGAGKAFQPNANADSGATWGSDFASGSVGLFPGSYGVVLPKLAKGTKGTVGVRLLPGPSGGTGFFDGGDNLAIPRGSSHASAAWEFIRFCLDLPQQQNLPDGGYVPVRADAATPAFAAKYPLAIPTLQNLDKGYAPATLGYNLLFNQPDSPWIGMIRRAVLSGDVDGALEEGQAGFQRIIDQSQLGLSR